MTENETKYEGVIYLITNKVNGKKYVGQTIRDVNIRWDEHVNCAFNSKHPDYNGYLHSSIRKHGKDNFDLSVIWTITAKSKETRLDAMNFAEAYHIQEEDCFAPNGYNMTRGGDGRIGCKHTEETKRKISKSQIGWKHKPETIQRLCEMRRGENALMYGKFGADHNLSKAVIQYDMEGNFIAEYGGLSEAGRSVGISHSQISRVCRGVSRHCHGWGWKFKSDVDASN